MIDKPTTWLCNALVIRITYYQLYPIVTRDENLENITEMLKGILEGCVLEIIARGQTYGYEITRQLRTLGFEDVVEIT